MMGRGIDRHPLGLRCILSDEWAWLDNVSATSSDIGQNASSQDTITPGTATSQPVCASRAGVPLFQTPCSRKVKNGGCRRVVRVKGGGSGEPGENICVDEKAFAHRLPVALPICYIASAASLALLTTISTLQVWIAVGRRIWNKLYVYSLVTHHYPLTSSTHLESIRDMGIFGKMTTYSWDVLP